MDAIVTAIRSRPSSAVCPGRDIRGRRIRGRFIAAVCGCSPASRNSSPREQDAKLRTLDGTYFFTLLRRHTIEGMFCDPMHGGNAGLVGWKLIGFPGPYMSWYDDIDKHPGTEFRPEPKSLEEVMGRVIVPWEESRSTTRGSVKTLPHTDVVIVGGGWSGLLMAKELGARTSLSITVLERGNERPPRQYCEGMDELDYAIRFRLMQDVSRETFTFRHTSKDRALPIRQFAVVLPRRWRRRGRRALEWRDAALFTRRFRNL